MYEQNPATTSNNHISDHLQNLAFKKKRAQKKTNWVEVTKKLWQKQKNLRTKTSAQKNRTAQKKILLQKVVTTRRSVYYKT